MISSRNRRSEPLGRGALWRRAGCAALALVLLGGLAAACSDAESAADGGLADGLGSDGWGTETGLAEGGMDGWGRLDGATPACGTIPELLARVNSARMLADLEVLVGLGERQSHAGQQAAADYLRSQLEQIPGLQLRDHVYSYRDLPYVNLEASLPGTSRPERALLAGAHYDSTSSDPELAPGADDNASGAVAVLEAARVLAACQPAQNLRFVFFSNEELGTIGAQAYVAELKDALPADQLDGMINADMVGFAAAGEDLDVASRPEHAALVHQFTAAAEAWTDLPVKEVLSDQCG